MDVRKTLQANGCSYDGHFVGTSGNHLSGYWNIDPIMPHVAIVSDIAKLLAAQFAELSIDTVVAPAVGAIPLAHWVAYHLEQMTGKKTHGVWADKVKPEGFAFERSGFVPVVRGKRVLVVEDIINTMYSVRKLVELTKQSGGEVIGVAAVVAHKQASAKSIGVPRLTTLCEMYYDVYSPADCSKHGLCAQHVPVVVDIAHGDEFKEANPNYKGGFVKLAAK